MNNLLLSSLFLFYIISISIGQVPGVQWQKKLQPFAQSSVSTVIYALNKVKSGGFVMAGIDSLYLFNRDEALDKFFGGRPIITRVNTAGNTIWSSTYEITTLRAFIVV